MMCSARNPSSLIFVPFSLLLAWKIPFRFTSTFNVNVCSLALDVFSFNTYPFLQPLNRQENYAPYNNVKDIAAASATEENVSEDEKSCDESTTLLFNVSGALEESKQESPAEDQKEKEDEPEKETDEMI